jgi:hypothetical protein
MSVLFGFGPQASGAATRNVVITGYAKRVGIGVATLADGVVNGPILSVDDAGQKWGYGSEIHQGVAAALDQNADLTLYGVSFPEAGGGAYAEQTFAITNNAVLGGSLLFTVQGFRSRQQNRQWKPLPRRLPDCCPPRRHGWPQRCRNRWSCPQPRGWKSLAEIAAVR